MYPTGQQISFNATIPMNVQDSPTMMVLDSKEPSSSQTQNGGVFSHAEFALFTSKRLESDLKLMGNKLQLHAENVRFLKSQKTKLDESILDLEALMNNHPSTHENSDSDPQGEDISEQILKLDKSAAGVLSLVQTRHPTQASQCTLLNGFVGIVAKLGKVNDDNLSQALSNYLGSRSMLAFVFKNRDSIQALENYDQQGNIDRNAGLHGLGSSVGRTIEGHFDVICLENLRPYVGQYITDDPQRRLHLLKPKLPNGECPPGFLGYAVNMIHIDPAYLLCVTPYGYGLRETLFYTLFSRLQVYKTRADMVSALPCINDGAISLDGGIIRTSGIFTLGSCDEANVKFAKATASRTKDKYGEMEKQMKELQWKKDKIKEDIERERKLSDHANKIFAKKKEEFVKFLAQSSSPNQQMVSPR